MSPIPQEKNKLSILVAGVVALAAVSAGWMLSADTLDNHECFVSVTSREMFRSVWIVLGSTGPRVFR